MIMKDTTTIDWDLHDRLRAAAEKAYAAGDTETFNEKARACAINIGCEGEERIADFIKFAFIPQTPEERAAAEQWWRDYDMRLSYEDYYEERRMREEAAAAFAEDS